MIQTPYSPIKRYSLPYGKPWYPQLWHAYDRGKYPAGCGHEPDVGPLTEQQSWMREAVERYERMLHIYREADQDWPWSGDETGQLDLFKDVA